MEKLKKKQALVRVLLKLDVHQNNIPSGQITITGTTTENEILTINTSALTDADGLPSSNTYNLSMGKSQDKIEWDIITGATSGRMLFLIRSVIT